ncbi:hypothetical protein ACFL05_00750 [Patescibacteria group bacterium]
MNVHDIKPKIRVITGILNDNTDFMNTLLRRSGGEDRRFLKNKRGSGKTGVVVGNVSNSSYVWVIKHDDGRASYYHDEFELAQE